MKKSFWGYLSAPIKAMGWVKSLAAVVPATLALLTFMGWHNPILETLGLRLYPEDRLAQMVEAARCGELVSFEEGAVLYQERKECPPVQNLVLLDVAPTDDFQHWIVSYAYGPTRDDCTSIENSLTLLFNGTDARELQSVETLDNTLTADLAAQGFTNYRTKVHTLTAQAARQFYGQWPAAVRWQQSFDCEDGRIRENYPDIRGMPVPRDRDHIWQPVDGR